MRVFIILLILTLLLMGRPQFGLGGDPDPDDDVTSPQEIRHWTQQILLAHHLMDSARYLDRLKGVRLLTSLPPEAEPIIIERIPRISVRARLHTFEALVNRASPFVAALVLKEAQISPQISPHIHERLVRILQLAQRGWETLRDELKQQDSPHPGLEKLYLNFIEREVRDHFLFCLKTYKAGGFRYMFAKVWKYGEPAFHIMVKIVRGEARRLPYYDAKNGRELASQALIVWPHPSEKKKEILKSLAEELKQQAHSNWLELNGRLYSLYNVQFALHSLGELQDHITSEIKRREISIQTYLKHNHFGRAIYEYDNLSSLYMSILDDSKAIQTFHHAIAAYIDGEEPANGKSTIALTWYNLACLRSLSGNTSKAVSALQQAVTHGYQNFEWIWLDRDLEAVWSSEKFKKWIEELRTQEEWNPHIPNREPGTLPEE